MTDTHTPRSRHDAPMSLPVKIIVYTSFVLALTPTFVPVVEWWARVLSLAAGVVKL